MKPHCKHTCILHTCFVNILRDFLKSMPWREHKTRVDVFSQQTKTHFIISDELIRISFFVMSVHAISRYLYNNLITALRNDTFAGLTALQQLWVFFFYTLINFWRSRWAQLPFTDGIFFLQMGWLMLFLVTDLVLLFLNVARAPRVQHLVAPSEGNQAYDDHFNWRLKHFVIMLSLRYLNNNFITVIYDGTFGGLVSLNQL